MAQTFDDFFISLLFGQGAWLGVLIILMFVVALMLAWKYSGVLLIPVTIFLGIAYLGEDLFWHSIIMFLSAVFIMFYMAKQ